MLTYAVNKKTDKVEHIRNVKNGTDCNCICPVCKEPLSAKQGAIKDWHFAHTSKIECIGSDETALHMRAKEILTSLSFINLPGLEVQVIASPLNGGEDIWYDSMLINYGQRLELDIEKVVEKAVNNFRPDLIVYHKGTPLIVEIAVTHFVDADKVEKIEASGISAIEIDLSIYKDKEIDDEELINSICYEFQNKEWIYNNKLADAHLKAKIELASIYGGEIQYMNKYPDGVKYSFSYIKND